MDLFDGAKKELGILSEELQVGNVEAFSRGDYSAGFIAVEPAPELTPEQIQFLLDSLYNQSLGGGNQASTPAPDSLNHLFYTIIFHTVTPRRWHSCG